MSNGRIDPGEVIVRKGRYAGRDPLDAKLALALFVLRAIAYGNCEDAQECARLVVEARHGGGR